VSGWWEQSTAPRRASSLWLPSTTAAGRPSSPWGVPRDDAESRGSLKGLLAAANKRQILESMGLRGGGGVTSRRRHLAFPRTGNDGRRLAQERSPSRAGEEGLHSPRLQAAAAQDARGRREGCALGLGK
jgi:hypothetical protein